MRETQEGTTASGSAPPAPPLPLCCHTQREGLGGTGPECSDRGPGREGVGTALVQQTEGAERRARAGLAMWSALVGVIWTLQEAGGGLRAAGDSEFRILWYRQSPGDTLEWVSFINYDPREFRFDQSVKGRATISRDNSRSEAYLSLQTLHPNDSARYFCAVHTGKGSPAEL
uniref:Immunoglobulin V-set domain-containing protein n=1 Tax=Malurus cyaneus samueli TaxID=2593467 RepID=A0A8C5TRI9_9PASS